MSQPGTKRISPELAIVFGAAVLLLLPLLGIPVKTYLTLTIAGLAMGMLLFLIASGVSIIFGLMDVLNFAHGALFAGGAYVGFSVFGWLRKWVEADSVFQNFGVFLVAKADVRSRQQYRERDNRSKQLVHCGTSGTSVMVEPHSSYPLHQFHRM